MRGADFRGNSASATLKVRERRGVDPERGDFRGNSASATLKEGVEPRGEQDHGALFPRQLCLGYIEGSPPPEGATEPVENFRGNSASATLKAVARHLGFPTSAAHFRGNSASATLKGQVERTQGSVIKPFPRQLCLGFIEGRFSGRGNPADLRISEATLPRLH